MSENVNTTATLREVLEGKTITSVDYLDGDLKLNLEDGHAVVVAAYSDVFDNDYLKIKTFKRVVRQVGEITL